MVIDGQPRGTLVPGDVVGCRLAAETARFGELADTWWDEYYGPMELRVEEFRIEHPGDPLAVEIADEVVVSLDRSAVNEVAVEIEDGHTSTGTGQSIRHRAGQHAAATDRHRNFAIE